MPDRIPFPDRYRDRLFLQTDHFLGAARKAMPANLSRHRPGSRVLDLLEDTSHWGDPKLVPGEGDVFKNDPDHERYEHTNIDYLRLNRVSRFDGGWQPVPDGSKVEARFDLKWTFPRSCAQIIMGDGKSVKRQQVDLRNTGSFGEQSFRTSVDVTGQR